MCCTLLFEALPSPVKPFPTCSIVNGYTKQDDGFSIKSYIINKKHHNLLPILIYVNFESTYTKKTFTITSMVPNTNKTSFISWIRISLIRRSNIILSFRCFKILCTSFIVASSFMVILPPWMLFLMYWRQFPVSNKSIISSLTC